MIGTRRHAREDALQVLYQIDINAGRVTPSHALQHFESSFSAAETVDPFTHRLVLGVSENRETIDQRIDVISEHWRTDRMAIVDRNLLRLGAFELFYCDDIPATVSINEMIELAKQFGSETSASFINGILDKMKSQLECPNKAP